MNDYKRGLNDETIKNILKDCIDKIEGINKMSWQDITNKYNLQCNPDVLRKAFTGIMGGYLVYRFMSENNTKNSLDEIREEISRLEILKSNIRSEKGKLSRLNNKLSQSVGIAEDIIYYLKKDVQNVSKLPYKRITSNGGYKLLVCVSDWHIGYIIKDYKGNNYNYEIAKKRLGKLISEIEKVCIRYNIVDIVIVQLGDITENTYMRETQQAYECEFSMSEQVSKAIKLLYEFVTDVSEFANVTLVSLGGNHSRVSTKASNIEGDNFNVIINEAIKTLVEISENKRINVTAIDYIEDAHKFKINGLTIKAFHGDKLPKDAKKLYDTEISLEGEKIDLILRGHYHSFNIESQNNNAYVITCGSLFGYNVYSNNTVRAKTNASQCLIVLGDKEIESIKNVNLQFN